MKVRCIDAKGSYEWHAEGSLWCKERAREGALRKAKEAAWDEGYEAAGKVVHPGVNPYRRNG